jgi:hypothetical protein
MKKLLRLVVPVVLSAVIFPHTMFAAGDWRGWHPPQLILTKTTAIYDDSNQKIAELTPQTVTVTGAYLPKGYEIETWLGKKWIYTTDFTKAIPHDPNFGTKQLQLNEKLSLYDGPVPKFKTVFSVSPQVVQAVDYWDGFYKINTWLGDKWIEVPNINGVLQGATELKNDQINQKITLTVNTALYQGASKDKNVLGTLAPQTVESFEKTGNWYHIHTTWVGDAWIFVFSEDGDMESNH